MSRDDTYLIDILESAKIALKYIQGKTWNDFQEDIQCQDAIIRRIEIIGEAARRVSLEKRILHPQIPWKEMSSMRNLVIHEYDVVDTQQVWDTINNDFPVLIKDPEDILLPKA